MTDKADMEAGPQPLDALMESAGMRNHDLVEASSDGLTHKQVGKARRGRKLTRRLQEKILGAWNGARGEQRVVADLFNYRGR